VHGRGRAQSRPCRALEGEGGKGGKGGKGGDDPGGASQVHGAYGDALSPSPTGGGRGGVARPWKWLWWWPRQLRDGLLQALPIACCCPKLQATSWRRRAAGFRQAAPEYAAGRAGEEGGWPPQYAPAPLSRILPRTRPWRLL
jgi:hypothetical protein